MNDNPIPLQTSLLSFLDSRSRINDRFLLPSHFLFLKSLALKSFTEIFLKKVMIAWQIEMAKNCFQRPYPVGDIFKKAGQEDFGSQKFYVEKASRTAPLFQLLCKHRGRERERAQKNRQTISLYKYTREKGKGFLFFLEETKKPRETKSSLQQSCLSRRLVCSPPLLSIASFSWAVKTTTSGAAPPKLVAQPNTLCTVLSGSVRR